MASEQPIELLFLHPLPFVGAFWKSIQDRFPQLTTHTPTIYSIGESLQEVALAILNQLDGDRLIVVGNSIGGSCALEVAAAAPDRVEHLVLIGSKAAHRPDPQYRDWALNLLRTDDGAEALWAAVWEPLFSPRTAPEVVERAKAEALAVSSDLIASGIEMFHGRRDLMHVVDNWSKPISLMTGAHDTAPGPARSREMARRAHRGRLHVIPHCGHYVPIEQHELFTSILSQTIAAAL